MLEPGDLIAVYLGKIHPHIQSAIDPLRKNAPGKKK
jgi:hypothetical protein